LGGFSLNFWVANTLELFERFAFYGSKAVLAIYIAEHLGLGAQQGTFLAGSVFNTLIYLLPLLAGTVVDRYGTKRSLLACFAIFAVGYLLIGLAGLPLARSWVEAVGVRNWTLAALIITAAGGSLIKPSIVGTVARTTTPGNQALGYSIYYTLVNVGGALGPLIGLSVRENAGIAYVLVMSSATSALLAVATLLFYREPVGQQAATSLLKVIRDARLVFADVRFMLFLVIFAGFWTMFWHIFYALPFYVKDHLGFERFEFFETVDAITIIVVTIPVAALARRLPPLSAMTLGVGLASASWFLMASVPTRTVTVIALAVFAIGEAIQAPRFYEYVAALAPRERVGTYMGFAFMPVAIGTFACGWVSGYLVQRYLQSGTEEPPHMWYVVGGIGVVTTVLMVLYDRWLRPRS
jgi:dipeptide/tripeptide permease